MDHGSRQDRPSRAERPARARSGLLRRFGRAQEGATAVEFALVAIPFLMLVFAIFQLGLVFLASMTLENALANVDRRIRTGEFQSRTTSKQAFQDAVCGEMSWLAGSCPTALILDVRVMPSFASATGNGLGRPKGETCWDTGGANSIVLVRGYYKWPLIMPMMEDVIEESGGYHEISFANVFSNEPYDTKPAEKVTCPA